jgi:hypothetical protein
LRAKKDEADRERRSKRERTPEEKPDPANEQGGKPEAVEVDPVLQQADAAAEEVARLLERLAAKEQEKRAVRRARQEARTVQVEKDW